MSALNPYEKFLDGRPVERILELTPNKIAIALAEMGADKSTVRPAPDKWSPAEVVAHLADCELVFAFRLRQTLAEDNPTIQSFDQDKWAATYSGISASEAHRVFSSIRGWNLDLIQKALPAAASRPVSHPERGAMTFMTIVETMAGHDLNHLEQLQRVAAQSA